MSFETAKRILIVEDDEGVSKLQRRTLERHGYAVHCATSSEEALAAVQRCPVDLVLMDYRLPDSTTGLELFNKLKDLGFDLPVIMVTGFSNEETAIEALRCGIRDFVPKTREYLDYLPDAVDRVLNAVHTERQLALSEARFQLFMDNSPAIAFLKDSSGGVLYANRRFADECQQPHWQGKTDKELWPAETAELLRSHDTEVLVKDQPLSCTEQLTRGDGTVRHWLTCRFPLHDASGRRLIGGMAVDVTEQRAAEEGLRLRDEQLRQSQKMEAIGQLAGGVAHDFNNMLTIILGYSELLREQMPENSEAGGLLQDIHKAGERAALLTRQLLAFSRRQVLKPKMVNMNDVVTGIETMLRRLIGEDIEVRTVLADGLEPISADPGQLEQVLMNLAVNARDAMPQGGEMSIETAVMELDEQEARSRSDLTPGRYVALSVADSGCGMDEATQSRIFEPFFTTKEPGKGTGLGLATVYGIVTQSGGYIRVSSAAGRGTTFQVFFPVAQGAESSTGVDQSPKSPLRGDETILLVEDEDSVRALSRNALQTYGYNVLEARDPLEAVRISRAHPGAIDVLVTDVVLPQLNGRRLAELLSPDRPDMPVLYVSGYTDDAIIQQGISERGTNFLQKPFTPNGLASKVRELLDHAVPSLN